MRIAVTSSLRWPTYFPPFHFLPTGLLSSREALNVSLEWCFCTADVISDAQIVESHHPKQIDWLIGELIDWVTDTHIQRTTLSQLPVCASVVGNSEELKAVSDKQKCLEQNATERLCRTILGSSINKALSPTDSQCCYSFLNYFRPHLWTVILDVSLILVIVISNSCSHWH